MKGDLLVIFMVQQRGKEKLSALSVTPHKDNVAYAESCIVRTAINIWATHTGL